MKNLNTQAILAILASQPMIELQESIHTIKKEQHRLHADVLEIKMKRFAEYKKQIMPFFADLNTTLWDVTFDERLMVIKRKNDDSWNKDTIYFKENYQFRYRNMPGFGNDGRRPYLDLEVNFASASGSEIEEFERLVMFGVVGRTLLVHHNDILTTLNNIFERDCDEETEIVRHFYKIGGEREKLEAEYKNLCHIAYIEELEKGVDFTDMVGANNKDLRPDLEITTNYSIEKVTQIQITKTTPKTYSVSGTRFVRKWNLEAGQHEDTYVPFTQERVSVVKIDRFVRRLMEENSLQTLRQKTL